MNLRKDALPSETVKNVRLILKNNGFKVVEKKYSYDGVFFSARVELKSFQGIGTNGKGITKDAALASAYAELMERLQSRFLIKPYFLNKIKTTRTFEDEELLPQPSFIELCKKTFSFFPAKILDAFLNSIGCNEVDYRYTLSFYNYIKKQFEPLPFKIINILTHSNGLCAGNTFSEAVSHGICEIMERYIYKKIMLNEISPSNLKLRNIKALSSYPLLQKIEDLGYHYSIKDCSLNGTFPVVGVLISNQQKDAAVFAIGSDVDFDIALQRCLTEIFQGIDTKEKFDKKLSGFLAETDDLYTNWMFSYTANIGKIPSGLLVEDRIATSIPKCFKLVSNNTKALDHLISILKNNVLDLFIKDLSYLDFPTYKLYIPGMSEIEDLRYIDTIGLKKRSFLFEIFYNLEKATSAQISEFKEILQKLAQIPFYKELNLPISYFSAKGLIDTELAYYNFSELVQQLENILQLSRRKKILPKCPNCDQCSVKCNFKKWAKYNSILRNKYIGYLIHRNTVEKNDTLSVQELRPDMTQCRIIQIDKHLGNS